MSVRARMVLVALSGIFIPEVVWASGPTPDFLGFVFAMIFVAILLFIAFIVLIIWAFSKNGDADEKRNR